MSNNKPEEGCSLVVTNDLSMQQLKLMRIELTRYSIIRSLMLSRWPQFILTSLALTGFLLAILTGWFGTPVGSRNFSIIFVWIAWWAILMLIAVPFFGRGWCSICPIPAPGEWLQRGALLQPNGKGGLSLGKRWPNKFRNIWLQNGAFLLVALFSIIVLTQPRFTAVVLTAFLSIAVATSLIFERRAFCRYLCPVGGFIGLYSQLAPIELRVKDAAICASHKTKDCYNGNLRGYGCPWQVFPGGLTKNTHCGLCMECLRTCTEDNILVQTRPFAQDLILPGGRRLDEAYKAFIMLGSALVYMSVLLGPWGSLKSAAYQIGSAPWFAYVAAFLVFVLAVVPGLFSVAVLIGRRLAGLRYNARRSVINFAYALIPLGLAAWIAFSLSFVFANLTYLAPALSDPFGWGWDLIGAAGVGWSPLFTETVPLMQIAILTIGLFGSISIVRRIAAEGVSKTAALYQSIPISLFCVGATILILTLLIA